MFTHTFTVRFDFRSGTFQVVSFGANSVSEAVEMAWNHPAVDGCAVESVTVVGSFDNRPQTFMAW